MGEGLTIIFSIILVPALGFAIWLRTPQGERFLKKSRLTTRFFQGINSRKKNKNKSTE